MDTNREVPYEFKPEDIQKIKSMNSGQVVPAKTRLMDALGIHPCSFMRLTPIAFAVKTVFGTCPSQ